MQPFQQQPLLDSLKADLRHYQDHLEGLWYEILHTGISKYPMLIAHREPVSIGTIVVDHTTLGTNWSISLSALEELLKRGLLGRETALNLRQAYKDPRDSMCVLLVTTAGMNIIFMPWERGDGQDATKFLDDDIVLYGDTNDDKDKDKHKDDDHGSHNSDSHGYDDHGYDDDF